MKMNGGLKLEKRKNILAQVEQRWFDYEKELNSLKSDDKCNNIELINNYRNLAHQIYEQDITNYSTFREKTRRSDHNWIRTVLSSGTTNDKISANCILIQDSAVHNLKNLDNLISYVKINKKRECILAIDSLKDLFINYLLPNRQLKNFNENPIDLLSKISDVELRDKYLLYWYFESMLKTKYIQFIKAIQQVFQDTVAVTKIKLVSTIMDLIGSDKKEQEKQLIEIVVNKLGDPDYKVASKVVYETNKLLIKISNKKMEFLLEIERLICRPNINQKAQYYGFCCINQIVLSRKDTNIANRLLTIYFSFFKVILVRPRVFLFHKNIYLIKKYIKNKEIDNRLLNVILTGVNRAYKYSKMSNEDIDNNLNTLFKIVHVTSFNVSIQALMLLNQVVESRDDMQQRYYNALYRKLFDLEYKKASTKQTYFLNLLFSSMKKDDCIPRIKAFVKRLLQICLCQNVPFVCGSLILLSELFKVKKNFLTFDNNLIIREGVAQKLKKNKKQDLKLDEDDDDLEVFHDIKDESDIEQETDDIKHEESINKSNNKSWIHKNNTQSKKNTNLYYDYTYRNPMYCGADKTLTYELILLEKHYHPTVALFARKLMNEESIEYTGDPIEDFTLMHFLDRFVYKNPKKIKNKEQELKSKKSVFSTKQSTTSKVSSIKQLPINSKEYLNIDLNKIPEDEKIFYEFFKKQALKSKDALNEENDDEEEVLSEVSDGEFDEYLDKIQGDGVSKKEEDFDFDDIDFADGLSKSSKKKNKKNESSDEDDYEDVDDDDDEEFEKELEKEIDEIEDDEDVSLDGDDDDNEDKNDDNNNGSLFASADEFAELLNEAAEYESFGVGSFSNKDNASIKQLKWEMDNNMKKSQRGSSNKSKMIKNKKKNKLTGFSKKKNSTFKSKKNISNKKKFKK